MCHPLGNTGLLSLNLKYTTIAETPFSLSNISDVGFLCVCVCKCVCVCMLHTISYAVASVVSDSVTP